MELSLGIDLAKLKKLEAEHKAKASTHFNDIIDSESLNYRHLPEGIRNRYGLQYLSDTGLFFKDYRNFFGDPNIGERLRPKKGRINIRLSDFTQDPKNKFFVPGNLRRNHLIVDKISYYDALKKLTKEKIAHEAEAYSKRLEFGYGDKNGLSISKAVSAVTKIQEQSIEKKSKLRRLKLAQLRDIELNSHEKNFVAKIIKEEDKIAEILTHQECFQELSGIPEAFKTDRIKERCADWNKNEAKSIKHLENYLRWASVQPPVGSAKWFDDSELILKQLSESNFLSKIFSLAIKLNKDKNAVKPKEAFDLLSMKFSGKSGLYFLLDKTAFVNTDHMYKVKYSNGLIQFYSRPKKKIFLHLAKTGDTKKWAKLLSEPFPSGLQSPLSLMFSEVDSLEGFNDLLDIFNWKQIKTALSYFGLDKFLKQLSRKNISPENFVEYLIQKAPRDEIFKILTPIGVYNEESLIKKFPSVYLQYKTSEVINEGYSKEVFAIKNHWEKGSLSELNRKAEEEYTEIYQDLENTGLKTLEGMTAFWILAMEDKHLQHDFFARWFSKLPRDRHSQERIVLSLLLALSKTSSINLKIKKQAKTMLTNSFPTFFKDPEAIIDKILFQKNHHLPPEVEKIILEVAEKLKLGEAKILDIRESLKKINKIGESKGENAYERKATVAESIKHLERIQKERKLSLEESSKLASQRKILKILKDSDLTQTIEEMLFTPYLKDGESSGSSIATIREAMCSGEFTLSTLSTFSAQVLPRLKSYQDKSNSPEIITRANELVMMLQDHPCRSRINELLEKENQTKKEAILKEENEPTKNNHIE